LPHHAAPPLGVIRQDNIFMRSGKFDSIGFEFSTRAHRAAVALVGSSLQLGRPTSSGRKVPIFRTQAIDFIRFGPGMNLAEFGLSFEKAWKFLERVGFF
jgi:hypothetical protein